MGEWRMGQISCRSIFAPVASFSIATYKACQSSRTSYSVDSTTTLVYTSHTLAPSWTGTHVPPSGADISRNLLLTLSCLAVLLSRTGGL
jgi:hypothetical protein